MYLKTDSTQHETNPSLYNIKNVPQITGADGLLQVCGMSDFVSVARLVKVSVLPSSSLSGDADLSTCRNTTLLGLLDESCQCVYGNSLHSTITCTDSGYRHFFFRLGSSSKETQDLCSHQDLALHKMFRSCGPLIWPVSAFFSFPSRKRFGKSSWTNCSDVLPEQTVCDQIRLSLSRIDTCFGDLYHQCSSSQSLPSSWCSEQLGGSPDQVVQQRS